MAFSLFNRGDKSASGAGVNAMGAPSTGVDLVLEGGGMRGIFTAGVLDVLMEQGVYGFDTVWGVSAGAINAASYLSRQQGRYMRETLAFRDDSRFMGFKSLATTGDIAGADFLYHKIQDEIEDRLAEEIIAGNVKAGDRVVVTTKNKALVVERE